MYKKVKNKTLKRIFFTCIFSSFSIFKKFFKKKCYLNIFLLSFFPSFLLSFFLSFFVTSEKASPGVYFKRLLKEIYFHFTFTFTVKNLEDFFFPGKKSQENLLKPHSLQVYFTLFYFFFFFFFSIFKENSPLSP